MTADCVVVRITDGPPPYPLPDGWTPEAQVWPAPGETGRCRVQELKRENTADAADQPTELRQYLIGLPYGAPPFRTGERGDILRTVGREFNLKQSMAGSELWQADYIAWENQTQQQ